MKNSFIAATLLTDPTNDQYISRIQPHVMAALGVLAFGSVVYPAMAQVSQDVTSQNAGTVGQAIGVPGDGAAAIGQSSIGGSGQAGDTLANVFSASLGQSITRDSNLFRVSDTAGNPRSDTISATSVSVRFNKPIAQQRFQLEATEVFNRYSNSSYLNFNAANYRGAWLWSPSTRWNITVSADRTKALAAFDQSLGGSQRNVTTTQNQGIIVDGWIVGSWYAILGANRSESKSDQGVMNRPDENTNNVNAGVRYVTDSGNSVTAMRTETKGDYQDQSAIPTITGSGFRANETSLAADWKFTEKSELQGRIARVERSNSDIGQRDFSGPSAELAYTWRPTGKLSLNLSANKGTSALVDPSYSYVESQGVSFKPTWEFSDKLNTHLSVSRSKANYRGEGVVAPSGPAREEVINTAEIGVNWLPIRNVSVLTSVQRQRRTSNLPGVEFDDNLAQISASWLFW